jgi:hexosaminidase
VSPTSILPHPQSQHLADGSIVWESVAFMVSNELFMPAMTQFASQLESRGLHVPTINASPLNSDGLFLKFQQDDQISEEGYELIVSPKQIIIKASANKGCFYACQSLLQLLPIQKAHPAHAIPCLHLKDHPRFAYRGMHLDVSRHFFTVEEIKEFIRIISSYKINHLHLHLTDDQGWRIEIEKYPLLTEYGAWRTHNNQDSLCLERATEDETYLLPADRYKNLNGQKKYGGYYSKEQMRDLIHYAADHYMTIVPEVDVPGHFMAAIDNYPFLSCTGESGWGEHFSFPACLGKESTYEFIEDVLGEIAELFPGEYIHIGGDEVNINSWKECKHCQSVIRKEQLKDEHELQTHFNKHIERFLQTKGKRLLGWDEIAQGGLTPDATVMWWRNWAPKLRHLAANNGNDLIITPDFEYYFDFSHKATPLEKVYNYEPVPEDFTPQMAKHVKGVQANIWTERIPNTKRLYYQSLPRLLALAETGWTNNENKDFKRFNKDVTHHYDRFDAAGLFYHLPPIEGLEGQVVFIDKAKLNISLPLEDMTVYYSTDGSTPTPSSKKYTKPVVIDESCTVRLRSYRREVFSEIVETTFDKQQLAEPVELHNPVEGLTRTHFNGRYGKLVHIPADNSEGQSLIVDNINLGEFTNDEFFALRFEGYFYAPTDGIYTFYTSSDDGDQLLIHNRLIVDNKGSHAAHERNGMIALKKGYHPVKHEYRQLGGGLGLAVWVKAPQGSKRLTQADDWKTESKEIANN